MMDRDTANNASIVGVEVGRRFAANVRRDLGEHLEEIVRRNFTDAYETCCATHDFCDSNELMAEAFKDTLGREARVDDDVDTFIWNIAWSEARGSDFKEESFMAAQLGKRALTEQEATILLELYDNDNTRGWFAQADGAQEFDVSVEGEHRIGLKSWVKFRAWMPLAWLHDRPEFWVHDDWSFMRDIPRDELMDWFTEIQNGRPAELMPADSAGVLRIIKEGGKK